MRLDANLKQNVTNESWTYITNIALAIRYARQNVIMTSYNVQMVLMQEDANGQNCASIKEQIRMVRSARVSVLRFVAQE